MSFGGGGSQGTIRYALIVDDAQATQKLNTFKNSLTQLATPTANINKNLAQMGTTLKTNSASITQSTTQINAQTAAQQKLATVTATTGKNVATMGNQFQATTNKIKNAGAPLANLEKTSTSLGTTIKNNASKFSGLATGMSATASGALQLAAGFRDYNDAQIAVDRVTRRLSLGQEALGKAQAKLVALQKSGKASSAELAQAQLDVTQAQEQVRIQTELVGEAQERMFDSQTQFVASVVPTVLGAVGTLGSAFKDFGGSIGKLTGAFSALKGAGGLGGMLGILGPLGLAVAGVAGGFLLWKDATDKAQKTMEGVRKAGAVEDVTERVKAMNTEFDKLKQPFSSPVLNTIFNLTPGRVILEKTVEKAKELNETHQKTLTVSAQVKIKQDEYNKALDNYNDKLATRQVGDEKQAKIDLDAAKRQLDAIKGLEAAKTGTDDLTKAVEIYNKAGGTGIKTTEDLTKTMAKYEGQVNVVTVATDALAKMMEPGGPLPAGVMTSNLIIQEMGKSFDVLKEAGTTAITEIDQVLEHLPEKTEEWNEKIEEAKVQWQLMEPSTQILDTIDDVLGTITMSQGGWTRSIEETNKKLDEETRAADVFRKKWTDAMDAVIAASGGSTEVIIANRRRAADYADQAAEEEKKVWLDAMDEVIAASGGSTNVIIDNMKKAGKAAEDAGKAFKEKLAANISQAQQNLADAFDVKINKEKIQNKILDYIPDNIKKKIKADIKLDLSAGAAKETIMDVLWAGIGAELPEKKIDKLVESQVKYIREKFKGNPNMQKMADDLAATVAGPKTAKQVADLMLEWEAAPIPVEISPENLAALTDAITTGITGMTPPEVPIHPSVTIDPNTLGQDVKDALGITGAATALSVPAQAELQEPTQTYDWKGIAKALGYTGPIKGEQGIPIPVFFTPAQPFGAAVGGAVSGGIQGLLGKLGLKFPETGGPLFQNPLRGNVTTPTAPTTGMGGSKDIEARQVAQLTKNYNVLARAISQVTTNNNQLAKTTAQVSSNNNTLARTIVTVTKDYNIEARAIVTVVKDNNQLAKTIVQITKNNNTLAKTTVTVTKDYNQLARAVAQNTKNNNTYARTLKQVANNLDDVASSARKAASAIKSIPSGGGGFSGGGFNFQHGYHGWVSKATRFVAGEAGPEYVSVTPKSQMGSTSSSSGGGTGGAGNIVVNLTNVLADREITRTFRREMGKDIYRFGPS